jgi:hypothetical protein
MNNSSKSGSMQQVITGSTQLQLVVNAGGLQKTIVVAVVLQ